MAVTIKLKRGSGSNPGTSDLSVGEVALRTDNATLFTKNDAGNIAEIGAQSGISDGDKGDITVSSSGTTWTIDNGAIDNANINASAAIAGTKISPDFGSQNIVTTGTLGSGDLTLSGANPIINFTDTNNDSDFRIQVEAGTFLIEDTTNSYADRFRIASDGTVDVFQNLNVGAGLDVTGNITVSGTVDGVDIATRNTLFGGLTSTSGVLSNGVTATTQSASDNSTKVATTAYTDTAISNLVDSSPSALNTLNELAAALNDDANFSTTVTNSIATKLPLAGGTLTGDLTISSTQPKIYLTDTDSDSDYLIKNGNGDFNIQDVTNSSNRLTINSSGNATFSGSVTTGTLIASGTSNSSITASGTNSHITLTSSGTNSNINLYSTGSNAQVKLEANNTDGTGFTHIDADTGVKLFHGGGFSSQKLATTSSGVTVSGTCTATTFSGSGASLTNVNATTLDSIDSGSFLRSDTADTMSANFILSTNNSYPLDIDGDHDAKIVLQGSNNPYIRWREGSTDKAYIQWATNGYLSLFNQEDDSGIIIRDAVGFTTDGSNYHAMWHAGNDGSGSGLDADSVDGIAGSSFLRSDAADNFNSQLTWNGQTTAQALDLATGDGYASLRVFRNNKSSGGDGMWIGYNNTNNGVTRIYGGGGSSGGLLIDGSGASDVDIAGNIAFNAGNDGAGSGLDADTLDGVQGASYLRSDADDTFAGVLTIDSSTNRKLYLAGSTSPAIYLQEGTTNKVQIQWDATNGFFYLWNEETNKGFQLGSNPNWYDGSGYRLLWNAGNDGSGSGLDADTVDGFGTSQSGGANNIAVFGSDGYLYVDDWIRVGNNDGIYCANGQHLFAGGDSSYVSWINRSDSATACGIGMQSSNGTTRGYSYADENMVGLLNGSGSWVFRVTNGNSSNGLQTGGGYLVWHQQNDGSGSGLDADTLDGYDSLNFIGTRGNTYYSPTTWIDWINTQAGLYWSGGTYGNHFYPENNRFLIARSGHANQTGLALYTQGTRRGYLYANSSDEIGLLDKDENWILRGTDDQRTVFYGEINIGGNQASNPFSKLEFGATQYGSCSIAPADDGSHKVGMNFYVDGSANTAINADFAGKITCYGEWRLKSGTNSDAAQSTDPVHCIGNPNTDGNTSNFARLVMQERTSHWISFKTGGGEHYGSIYKSGNNVVYGGTSDYRYKENVAPITDGITTLKRLRPVTYNWNEFSKFENTDTHRGFIAHEVQEVEPDAVSGTKDGMTYSGNCVNAAGETTQVNVQESQKKDGETWTKTHEAIDIQQLDERKLVPILTAALQEAVSKIEVLETKVAALESA